MALCVAQTAFCVAWTAFCVAQTPSLLGPEGILYGPDGMLCGPADSLSGPPRNLCGPDGVLWRDGIVCRPDGILCGPDSMLYESDGILWMLANDSATWQNLCKNVNALPVPLPRQVLKNLRICLFVRRLVALAPLAHCTVANVRAWRQRRRDRLRFDSPVALHNKQCEAERCSRTCRPQIRKGESGFFISKAPTPLVM